MNAEKYRSGSMNERAIKYFKFISVSGANKTHQCVIQDCGNLIVGKKAGNLVQHIKSCHPDIFKNEIQPGNKNKSLAYYKEKIDVYSKLCGNCDS